MSDTPENTSSSAPFSFPKAEEVILDFWADNQVFEKSLSQTEGGPEFVFYDGPPFATGLPHYGHLLASTLKDIVPRYRTMMGDHVARRFGWDCHGVPIEYEIDKQFGKPTHEVIADHGLNAYTDACRGVVQKYSDAWRKTITRMGRWVDFDNDYKTMDTDFMESVWWVFKSLWDKGLIYNGNKVVPYSTELGTVLSNFEAGSNYQDTQDPSVVVLFPLADEDASLAIWTTTPWTLPSNIGICVNADLNYVKVKDNAKDITYYIAEDRLEAITAKEDVSVLETFKGTDLVGKSYEPPFTYFKQYQNQGAFKVHADDYVGTDSGTGLVHIAPAFGEDDARVMQAASFNANVCPIDAYGHFTDEVTDFAGMHVKKEADKAIMKDLKARGLLYQQGTIVHSYPFCPRSDTPLIYRAIPSWYVAVEQIKDSILAANEKIHWVPGHMKHGRFGKWLEGARDWAISRNRVWGTPLPLWINDESKNIICIGSIEELEKLTGKTITDLHRDHVDDLSFSQEGEIGVYRRVPEVLDCWFESGSMPYAQNHYPFENKKNVENNFPAQYIAEGVDQTRGWFYTLTILAAALFNKPAFENVIVNGFVMAEDGKKMSKRLKNYTPSEDLLDQYGADALRLYLMQSGLMRAEEQRFSNAGVKDMIRRTLLPWYNAFKFFQTYAEVDQWQLDSSISASEHILDQWILSRLQSLKAHVAKHMDAYHLYFVVPQLLTFIEDLTNTYIRLNRARFWESGMSADKQNAFTTLYNVLNELTRIMAPFTPFLSETIYLALKPFSADKDLPLSVHLCSYPQADQSLINKGLEAAVDRLTQILVLARQKRNDAKIKIKTPLPSLTVIHKDEALLKDIAKLEAIIKKEMNVKAIAYGTNEQAYINLFARPNSPVLGKRLQKKFGPVTKAIRALSSDEIETYEQAGSIEIEGETLGEGDLLIFREATEGSDVATNSKISLMLDTTLTDELIAEGLAREVINRIQKLRKDNDFNVSDRIAIRYQADAALAKVISIFNEMICAETLGLSLEAADLGEAATTCDIDGHALQLDLAVTD